LATNAATAFASAPALTSEASASAAVAIGFPNRVITRCTIAADRGAVATLGCTAARALVVFPPQGAGTWGRFGWTAIAGFPRDPTLPPQGAGTAGPLRCTAAVALVDVHGGAGFPPQGAGTAVD
jgi:hypothetical protein